MTYKHKKNFVIISYILIFVVFVAYYNSKSESVRNIGYNEGYDVGLQVGKQNGKAEGYNEGWAAGRDYGYKKGYEEGYDDAQINTSSCFSCEGRGVKACFHCQGKGCFFLQQYRP